MNLFDLPVAIPLPTPLERTLLRLAARGWYPKRISAAMGLREHEVDAALRRLAKAFRQAANDEGPAIGYAAIVLTHEDIER